MPVQMIELEEVRMNEASDEVLEATGATDLRSHNGPCQYTQYNGCEPT